MKCMCDNFLGPYTLQTETFQKFPNQNVGNPLRGMEQYLEQVGLKKF